MSEATPLPSASPRQTASAGPVRLRAVIRRVPRRPASSSTDAAEDDGYPGGAPPEPNMRLSRAVVVMVLLHVVAVGGVLAFGSIKERPSPSTRKGSNPEPAARANPGMATPDHAPTPFPGAASTSPSPVPSRAPVRPAASPSLSRVEADAVRLIESGGPNTVGAGERSYVVGRGETVQTIAQKLRVEPSALLRLNNIDDPRKIQAGQRLRVPPPTSSRTRS